MKQKKLLFPTAYSLIPAIIQDKISGDVFMLGYMNEEAFKKTKETGNVTFYSRKRKKLWMKGETSGNILEAKGLYLDCDNDTILVQARLKGTCVCHTGKRTCFFKEEMLWI